MAVAIGGSRRAASKGYTIQLHWNPDRTVHDLLDVVEGINRDYPIASLRWTVLHLYNASDDSLKRMKALGLIWGVQDVSISAASACRPRLARTRRVTCRELSAL